MFQSMVDMSVITWSGQAFYLLFTGQAFTENFFYGSVLDLDEDSGLDNLGVLHGQLSLCLGIACIVIFILIAAGTKSVGKVSNGIQFIFFFKVFKCHLSKAKRLTLHTIHWGHP